MLLLGLIAIVIIMIVLYETTGLRTHSYPTPLSEEDAQRNSAPLSTVQRIER